MLGHVTGRVAEWLCSGLQIRVRRFNSDLGLHLERKPRNGSGPCGVFRLERPRSQRIRADGQLTNRE